MTDVSQARKQSSPSASEGFDLAKLLLEGRAFFALIVIIVVFSILSPYYLSVANFLTMA
ncbi:ABC transporter permease, partial [Mesorhizobium sp. M7A.F.Ca.US.006.04.2.1]